MQRILLVEDATLTSALLVDVLERSGERQVVGIAETEEDAFRRILFDPVDAAVIDINLREGSGTGLLTRLHELDVAPKVRIVYTNGYDRSLHELCTLLGATEVISKDRELSALIDALEKDHQPGPHHAPNRLSAITREAV